jgi:hypothetical protein
LISPSLLLYTIHSPLLIQLNPLNKVYSKPSLTKLIPPTKKHARTTLLNASLRPGIKKQTIYKAMQPSNQCIITHHPFPNHAMPIIPFFSGPIISDSSNGLSDLDYGPEWAAHSPHRIDRREPHSARVLVRHIHGLDPACSNSAYRHLFQNCRPDCQVV